MTIEELDKRIERLQREQAIIATQFDQLQRQIGQTQTRYAQLTGGIEALNSLKMELNGEKPV